MTIQRFQSLKPAADMPQLLALFGSKRPQNGLSPRGGWYSIQNLADSTAEVSIYEEIGGYGITASDFVREFSAITANKITMRVSSPGGSVFDGIPIYNAIRRHPAMVTAYIDGLAASAASFIVMAADSVIMSPYAQMMIHEASGLVIGPADDMRQMADFLDKASNNIAAIYAERAGGTTEDWRALMKAETWFSDQEAVDAGLANSIDRQSVTNSTRTDYVKNLITPPPQDAVQHAAGCACHGCEEIRDMNETEPVTATALNWKKITEDIMQEAEESIFVTE